MLADPRPRLETGGFVKITYRRIALVTGRFNVNNCFIRGCGGASSRGFNLPNLIPTTACTDANRNGLVDGAASVTTINPAAVVAYNVDMSTYDERTGASTSRPRAPASATPHCGSNGLMSVAISTGFLRGSIYTTLTHQT